MVVFLNYFAIYILKEYFHSCWRMLTTNFLVAKPNTLKG